MTARVWCALAWLVLASSAHAVEFGGHVKAQLLYQNHASDDVAAAVVSEHSDLESIETRGNLAWRYHAWDVSVQGQLQFLHGDLGGGAEEPRLAGVRLVRLPLLDNSDRDQVFDLSGRISEGDAHLLGRLDRLALGFTRGPLVARAGRQASSWGGGLVFQVLDLFDPFPPDAIDTEYKPGVDMLTAQWLFDNGDDLQAIVVPRRASRDEPLTASRSSATVKWHHFASSLDLSVLVARHYEDDIAGLGASGNLAGGLWRCDLALTILDDGDAVFSGLVNFDRTWVWGGRNVAGYAEFFRNGFGVTSLDGGAESLPPPLLQRLGRGELFNLGLYELAAGLRLEWTPLTTIEPTILMNLNDASTYVLVQAHHDWRQNLELAAGAQFPIGKRGSEYGGLRLESFHAYLAPGNTMWLRASWYF
jgi:hypothetical protein